MPDTTRPFAEPAGPTPIDGALAPSLENLVVPPGMASLHYPKGTIEDYEERQSVLRSLARRWAELNPALKTFDPQRPKLRGATLAAQNARLLLKQAFPGTTFRVTTDKYSSGSSVMVEWTDWQEPSSPTTFQVRELLTAFQTGSFNGMVDEFEADQNLMREAFRRAFGSTTSVSPQPRPASDAERVAREQQALRAALDEADSVRKDPTADPQPAKPIRRARRL